VFIPDIGGREIALRRSNRPTSVYDTILFPTDGSEGTVAVAHRAGDLAATYDATVSVCAVVDARNRFGGSATEVDAADLGDARRVDAERAVEDAVAALPDGVETETTVAAGVPAGVIPDLAVEVGADLVVMGTRGRTGLDRSLHGSVTERVVRTAPVPVLTVPLASAEPS
jgi:nucleotide-binding universal stress UspA family protein